MTKRLQPRPRRAPSHLWYVACGEKLSELTCQDEDGDSQMGDGSGDESDATTTESPASGIMSSKQTPSFSSIGSPTVPTPEQLKTRPGGDKASDAVRAEGLMDTSESPLRL
jgi:protein phosphatase 2C family protein 2/3